MVFVDCEYIVNYDECCLYHCECNGCMDCKDQKPRENTGNSEDTNKGVISMALVDNANPDYFDLFDMCYQTGEYDDYDCYSCPHIAECSGIGDDNDDE